MGWEGPPEMLPDGSAPWLSGPDAVRRGPKTRPGRVVLQVLLWVLAGVALGGAVWAAMALLGDTDLLAAGPLIDAPTWPAAGGR